MYRLLFLLSPFVCSLSSLPLSPQSAGSSKTLYFCYRAVHPGVSAVADHISSFHPSRTPPPQTFPKPSGLGLRLKRSLSSFHPCPLFGEKPQRRPPDVQTCKLYKLDLAIIRALARMTGVGNSLKLCYLFYRIKLKHLILCYLFYR